MWPKFSQKSVNIDFQPLHDETEGRCLPAERTPSPFKRLLNLLAIAIQCILLIAIVFKLTRIAYILYSKGSVQQDQYAMEGITDGKDRYALMFEDFIVSYAKSYASDEEKEFRFSIFVDNVKYYEEYERRNPGVDLDVTKFADWTEEEMIRYVSRNLREMQFDGPRFEGSPRLDFERPPEMDWTKQGKLTPVKDQGQCGSCWAFATVASVEAAYAIKTGNLTRLSEQEMIDCDSQNSGCQGGYRPFAMNFVKQNGLMKEDEYPYRGNDHNQCLLKRMRNECSSKATRCCRQMKKLLPVG